MLIYYTHKERTRERNYHTYPTECFTILQPHNVTDRCFLVTWNSRFDENCKVIGQVVRTWAGIESVFIFTSSNSIQICPTGLFTLLITCLYNVKSQSQVHLRLKSRSGAEIKLVRVIREIHIRRRNTGEYEESNPTGPFTVLELLNQEIG